MFVPKSLERSLRDASQQLFAPGYLALPDDCVVPDESTRDCVLPCYTDSDGKRVQRDRYGMFDTNYERWAAMELHKRRDTDGAYSRHGLILQGLAAGYHHKSPAQLREIGDRVGRERIMVLVTFPGLLIQTSTDICDSARLGRSDGCSITGEATH